MYVNSMIFFITVSRKIKFCTVEYVTTRNMCTAMRCLASVINLYAPRGFQVMHALGDDEFLPMRQALIDKHNILYNEPSAKEHVGDIE